MSTRTIVELAWNNPIAQSYAQMTLQQFNDEVTRLSDELAGQPPEIVRVRVRSLLRSWEVNLEVAAQLVARHTTPRITTITR